ncbi:MAG: antitoxin family protein [Armatimonadetes bacterium]|nr:antitoxin family protein [Armatimonadota bacterium]PIU66793.1 MAG: hypothetical protein COS85_03255 [Armatimonadetes bacterium CG07_land_8_20_14_0_80_59_28]
MATVLEAIYENGVFRPLVKPDLPERQEGGSPHGGGCASGGAWMAMGHL